MYRLRKFLVAAVLLIVVIFAAGCGEDKTSAQSEGKSRAGSYDALVKQQPAHHMDYSPTRDTINKWIDTWKKPGALSYVYLLAGDGKYLGYYVLKGLPVTMCAALTPPYEFINAYPDGNDPDTQVTAPGVDGVYYSGGQCNDYYGFDAATGAYVEYTIGGNQSARIYNKPLPQAGDIPNLAPTG